MKRDRLAGEVGARTPLRRVASEHAKTRRESGQVFATWTLEVVDCHAAVAVIGVAKEGDGAEAGVVFKFDVELGGPVV